MVVFLGCAGIIGLFSIPALSTMGAISEAQALAMESQAVKDVVGEDIKIGAPTQSQQGQDVTMKFPLSGSDGEGTLVLALHYNSLWDIETTVLNVEFDDEETVDLLNSDEFNVVVEDDPDA